MPEYPVHREADVPLRDGSTVHVRPVRPGDDHAVETFLAELSKESLALRFFSAGANLDEAARSATDVDYADRYGLSWRRGVARSGSPGHY